MDSPSKPPHPGRIISKLAVPAYSFLELALKLGVTRTVLADVVWGRKPMTPDLAARLAPVLGGTAESWMQHQKDYNKARYGHRRKS